jgi:hypothetical protein
MFFRGSRYADVSEHQITDSRGKIIRYKKIRIIPKTEARMAHLVRQEDRLDLIAFRYFKNPERFWRICDANLAMWPEDLVEEAGKRIKIPPSEGGGID